MSEQLPTLSEVVDEIVREALEGNLAEALPTRSVIVPQSRFTPNAVNNDGTPVYVRVIIEISEVEE